MSAARISSRTPPISPGSITRVLWAVVFGLAAMSLLTDLSLALPLEGYWLLEIRDSFVRLFDLDGEANIPAWYSSSALLACAFLLAFVAMQKQRTQDRFFPHWVGLAIGFVYLSMDEAASIHEMAIKPLRVALGADGFLTFAWIIPGSLAVLVVAVIYARFLWSLPRRLRSLFLIAGVLYVGGAIGMEALSGHYATLEGRAALSYRLASTAEEAAEMAGVVVLIHALLVQVLGTSASRSRHRAPAWLAREEVARARAHH